MAASFTTGYALLIGVNDNNVPRWSLPDVMKDIEALRQVLSHLQRCAYPEENVKVITGKESTRQAILDGLDWLRERLAADENGNATVLVFYSGHGWQDRSSQPSTYYLIPYDVREESIRSRALRAEDFAEAIAALRPQRLLVTLDCCHSGGMEVKETEAPPLGYESLAAPAQLVLGQQQAISPLDGAKGLDELSKGSGRAVLSSSTAAQPSYMRRDRQMSIFTYHLIAAMTGHAPHEPSSHEVLVSDLMSHVYRQVPISARTDWGAEQTPDFQVTGNFAVAMLLGGKGLASGEVAPDPLVPPQKSAAEPDPTGANVYSGDTSTEGARIKKGNTVVVQGQDIRVGGDIVGGSKITWGKGKKR